MIVGRFVNLLIILKDYEFEIHESDILAIGDVGAYGFSMSSNYNSRPRVSEVMVNGNDVKLIRLEKTINRIWL